MMTKVYFKGMPEPTLIPHDQPAFSRRTRFLRRLSVAAIFILGAMGFHRFLYPPIKPIIPITWHEVEAKYGTRKHFDLPDGSKVWLNAGSSLEIADGFAAGKREVRVSGEAFFDVKHDPERPFLIHAGSMDVRVLGTRLNVRMDWATDEVTLIKGEAEIQVPSKSFPAIPLHPGEKVVMADEVGGWICVLPGPSDQELEIERRTPPRYQRYDATIDPTDMTVMETAWVDNKLVFRKESFKRVVGMIERWYNVHFYFKNDKYDREECSGYFKGQPLKIVMDSLQRSLKFRYKMAGDSVVIE